MTTTIKTFEISDFEATASFKMGKLDSKMFQPSYDSGSFAAAIRMAASISKIIKPWKITKEIVVRTISKNYPRGSDMDPDVVLALITALSWGGKLEYQDAAKEVAAEASKLKEEMSSSE